MELTRETISHLHYLILRSIYDMSSRLVDQFHQGYLESAQYSVERLHDLYRGLRETGWTMPLEDILDPEGLRAYGSVLANTEN